MAAPALAGPADMTAGRGWGEALLGLVSLVIKIFLFRGRKRATWPPVYAWHLPEILTPLPQDVVVAPIPCQLQDVGIAHGEYDKAWMAARDHLRSQGFPPSVYGAFVLGGTQHG